MRRNGFTLIEVMVGLFLLGLIASLTLPIINTSYMNLGKQRLRADMIYRSEMVMERLKAYRPKAYSTLKICDMDLKDIIEAFQNEEDVCIEIQDNDFIIDIDKSNKTPSLWYVYVKVYKVRGRAKDYVDLEAYIPKI